MTTKKLPVGYYIKQVDQLLTEGIDDIHAAYNIDRPSWQVLHFLFEKKVNEQSLLEELKAVIPGKKMQQIVADLISRGILKSENAELMLTEAGISLHGVCWDHQQQFRLKAMQGISNDQYMQLVETLEQIIQNLAK